MLAHLAIVSTLAGIGVWALAFYLGPTPGYLDVASQHLLRIAAGAACFFVAGVLALAHAPY